MAESASLPACMICGGTTQPYCTKTRYGTTWQVVRCTECGHGFVANRPTVEQLTEIYQGESHLAWDQSATANYENRRDAANAARAVASLSDVRGRSLDVGSADGAFSYHLARQGYRPTLIDLDPRAREAAKAIAGSTFYGCMLEELADPGPYATIMMSQVLEHALDPMAWLRRAADLLERGGVLAVLLPNFAGVYRLLGPRDPMIIPPVHLNFFTPRSLRLGCEKAGLKVARVRSASRMIIAGSLTSRAVRHVWNAVSGILDGTRYGIVLHLFAVRP